MKILSKRHLFGPTQSFLYILPLFPSLPMHRSPELRADSRQLKCGPYLTLNVYAHCFPEDLLSFCWIVPFCREHWPQSSRFPSLLIYKYLVRYLWRLSSPELLFSISLSADSLGSVFSYRCISCGVLLCQHPHLFCSFLAFPPFRLFCFPHSLLDRKRPLPLFSPSLLKMSS